MSTSSERVGPLPSGSITSPESPSDIWWSDVSHRLGVGVGWGNESERNSPKTARGSRKHVMVTGNKADGAERVSQWRRDAGELQPSTEEGTQSGKNIRKENRLVAEHFAVLNLHLPFQLVISLQVLTASNPKALTNSTWVDVCYRLEELKTPLGFYVRMRQSLRSAEMNIFYHKISSGGKIWWEIYQLIDET